MKSQSFNLLQLDQPRLGHVDADNPGLQDGQSYAIQDHPVLILYGAVTSLVVSVHILALLIATCILPLVQSSQSELDNINAAISAAVPGGADHARASGRKRHLLRSHHFFEKYIQLAWILSTGIGIVLFAMDLPLIAFIKVCACVCEGFDMPAACSRDCAVLHVVAHCGVGVDGVARAGGGRHCHLCLPLLH